MAFAYFFQGSMVRFSITSVLLLDKLCIFILNLSIIFLLTMAKILKRYFERNLQYFVTNINRRGNSVNFFKS